jgi:hypothetical protein
MISINQNPNDHKLSCTLCGTVIGLLDPDTFQGEVKFSGSRIIAVNCEDCKGQEVH